MSQTNKTKSLTQKEVDFLLDAVTYLLAQHLVQNVRMDTTDFEAMTLQGKLLDLGNEKEGS